VPVPEPGAGELLVRVRACSLNYRDLLMCRGQSASSAGEGGVVPLSDGAGEVVAAGAGVSRFRPGDRVMGCFFAGWDDGEFDLRYHDAARGGSADGMLSEFVVLPEGDAVAVPEHLGWDEAACLPCAGLTAWCALVERGGLRSGDWVLVLGTGGVSIFALQIATALGARVIATSSSDAKLAIAAELGATEGVNYLTEPDWERAVWRITGGRGVDHVVEVGGPGTLPKSLLCVRGGGRIALIGVLTGKGAPQGSLFPLLARNARMDGIYVGHRAAFERFAGFCEAHALCPRIDRAFGFDEVAEAYAYLASGAHCGKVVVKVGA
jgi:NADPH:quinone reductase-like Zn-dependent oxidoreductase